MSSYFDRSEIRTRFAFNVAINKREAFSVESLKNPEISLRRYSCFAGGSRVMQRLLGLRLLFPRNMMTRMILYSRTKFFIDRLGFSIVERAIFFSSFIAESLIALKRILPPPMSSDNNVVRSNYSTSGEY